MVEASREAEEALKEPQPSLMRWISDLAARAYCRGLITTRIQLSPAIYNDLLGELDGLPLYGNGDGHTTMTFHTVCGPIEIVEGAEIEWSYRRDQA
jgi:hypothetical protein